MVNIKSQKGNTTIIVVVVLIVLIALGVWFVKEYNAPEREKIKNNLVSNTIMKDDDSDDTMMEDQKTDSDSMMFETKIFDLDGFDFGYSIKEIRVKKGDKVRIELTSTDGFHDWVIDEFDAATERVNTGGKTFVEFVADQVGTFEYYCSVGQHRANGMVGNLIVENDTAMMEDNNMMTVGSYQDYSAESFMAAKDKKRVYFFHANWCPTCKAANVDLLSNLNKIPENVVIFKTDYDQEKELKEKYGISYQHTFVQVDADGNEIAKWNGGDSSELASRIK